MNKKKWLRRRKRLFEILEVGNDLDHASRAYDFFSAFMIVLNLAVSIMYTYDKYRLQCGPALLWIERITVATFAADYFLRIFTAWFLYEDEDDMTDVKAARKYVCSGTGIIDLLSWLPYFLPIFFPSGTVAFRMIRIVRIFRLFRINAYYDSLHVITQVIYGKRQQLVSSVVLILILMIGASLCMYSLEHEAQPDVFQNAFSGIWWAASTLLTIGYGDIYPVTIMGKALGIVISFLGVGMVAIPTGIISAGFVDMYATIKRRQEYGYEADMQFIKVHIEEGDKWEGKRIADLAFPSGLIVALLKRDEEVIIPRGDIIIQADDMIVLGAIPYKEVMNEHISLKEVVLKKQNPWTGMKIKDLDISRQSVIVLVKRRNKSLIPHGNMILEPGDRVFLYTKLHLADASTIEI
ncbi:MAG: ion transporter [Lachnospiraceae bacterium]|nr:ion transporter [Lachnospiraceae bacterium]